MHGCVVLLKDIHDVINYTDKSKEFEAAIQELQKAPGYFIMQINSVIMCIYVGAVVEVTLGSDNVLSGMYFQVLRMLWLCT